MPVSPAAYMPRQLYNFHGAPACVVCVTNQRQTNHQKSCKALSVWGHHQCTCSVTIQPSTLPSELAGSHLAPITRQHRHKSTAAIHVTGLSLAHKRNELLRTKSYYQLKIHASRRLWSLPCYLMVWRALNTLRGLRRAQVRVCDVTCLRAIAASQRG